MAARTALDFRCREAPAISVVAVLRDAVPIVLRMLAALRSGFAGDIDLILIDADPARDTRRIDRSVSGARVLRLDRDTNPAALANVALDRASADTLLLIDGAMDFAPGALARL